MSLKLIVCVGLALLVLKVELVTSNVPDRKYEVKCEVGNGSDDRGVGLPCQCSLFSYYNFAVVGTVGMLPEACDMCDMASSFGCSMKEVNVDVAAVLRGGCSFDTKALIAKNLGYEALIIVNTAPNEDAFPMGTQDSEFVSAIPVVMMHRVSQEYLSSTSSPPMMIEMVLDHARPPLSNIGEQDEDISLLGKMLEYVPPLPSLLRTFGPAILLCLVCVLSTPFKLQLLTGRRRNQLLTFLLTALFVLMRLGTFRTMEGSGGTELHHTETDERIFTALVDNVEKDFLDYSLRNSNTVSTLGLSVENYGDDIFIHPPVFVYSLYALKRFVGSSLPLSIVIIHTATLLLVKQITILIASRFGAPDGTARSTSLLAMAIFMSCPLAAFCSQKIWIDNALMLVCTVCAYGHIYLWMHLSGSSSAPFPSTSSYSISVTTAAATENGVRRGSIHPMLREIGVCVGSGAMTGVLVLNCKVTGVALIPFLGLSVLYSLQLGIVGTGGDKNKLSVVDRVLMPGLLYSVGVVLTHGPWVLCYYTITGRLLPNAWPSPTLIARNVFLQRAVSHSPSYYISILLRFSPIMIVGMLAAVVRPAVVWYKHKKAGVGTRSELRKAWWLVLLSTWPLGFLLMLTTLGVLGAGYQARFILPIIPATSILSALHLTRLTAPSDSDASSGNGVSPSRSAGSRGASTSTSIGGGGGGSDRGEAGKSLEGEAVVKSTIMALLLMYASMHSLYYSILAPHLHADLDTSFFDILSTALTHGYSPLSSEECGQDLVSFLRHMGFHIGR